MMRCVTPLVLLFPGVVAGVALGCTDANAESEVVHAAERQAARWIDDSGLHSVGFGQLSFKARDGHDLVAQVYRSTTFDPATGPIWFVMHGASRDVERYIRAAAPVAERNEALAIAIHFSKRAYPKGDDYTLGIQKSGLLKADLLGRPRWRSPDDTLYAEVEHLFDALLASLGGEQQGYYLFGHSAGAQFTHRLLTFLPEPRVLAAVAANAGWYTLPMAEDSRHHSMPYGLGGGPVDERELAGLFETPFVVLLGENDTTSAKTDRLVRGTPEAQRQGSTRLERGRNYFRVAEEQAAALNADFAWRLEIVPRAGHNAAQVIDSAGFLMFDRGAEPCASSSAADAAGLVMTEILADPPEGAAGDANQDGQRDPSDDEFVEIVNLGGHPICLAGWTLGDAKHQDRHVFPLAAALEPGQSLVVFGGGVPTGRFGGAQVQWAEGGLSLSNAGDVLSLRDAQGVLVRSVSWGDCDGEAVAQEHWPAGLGIDESLTRAADRASPWAHHSEEVEGSRYSPGIASGVSKLED